MSESSRPRCICTGLTAAVLLCVKVFAFILPFAQLVIGAKYQFDCPRQRFIPVYLLSAGVVTLLLDVLYILPCCAGFGNHSKIWGLLVSTFFVCWFIAGNVWIYSIYEPNYNKTISSRDTYCNKTVYLFAFWTTNVTYILFGALLITGLCSNILWRDTENTAS